MVSNIVFNPKVNIGEKIGVIHRGNILYQLFVFKFYYIIHSTLLTHKILVDTIIIFISNTHYIKLRIESLSTLTYLDYLIYKSDKRRVNKQNDKAIGWSSWEGEGNKDPWQILTGTELIQVLLFEPQSEKS